MRIFLTGGSGNLGTVLAYQLQKRGDTALKFDIQKPTDTFRQYIKGSILDRSALAENLSEFELSLLLLRGEG